MIRMHVLTGAHILTGAHVDHDGYRGNPAGLSNWHSKLLSEMVGEYSDTSIVKSNCYKVYEHNYHKDNPRSPCLDASTGLHRTCISAARPTSCIRCSRLLCWSSSLLSVGCISRIFRCMLLILVVVVGMGVIFRLYNKYEVTFTGTSEASVQIKTRQEHMYILSFRVEESHNTDSTAWYAMVHNLTNENCKKWPTMCISGIGKILPVCSADYIMICAADWRTCRHVGADWITI